MEDTMCLQCSSVRCTIISHDDLDNLTGNLQDYLVQRSVDRLETSQSQLMAWHLESIEDKTESRMQFFEYVRLIMLVTDKLIELGILRVTKQSPDEDQYSQIVEWFSVGP